MLSSDTKYCVCEAVSHCFTHDVSGAKQVAVVAHFGINTFRFDQCANLLMKYFIVTTSTLSCATRA